MAADMEVDIVADVELEKVVADMEVEVYQAEAVCEFICVVLGQLPT